MTLQVVIETSEFIKRAEECMNDESRSEFINYIARDPMAGDIIPDTGGARKVRWYSGSTKGKRGGVRIIYFYQNIKTPIYLFTAYKKNQRDNINNEEKNMLHRIIKLIVKAHAE